MSRRFSNEWREVYGYSLRLRSLGLSEDEAYQLVERRAKEFLRDPSHDRIIDTFYGAWSSERRDFNLTQVGNAERFVYMHGEDVRYCHEKGWYIWDGKRWERDETQKMKEMALGTIRSIVRDAERIEGNNRLRQRMEDWSRRSETNAQIEGMIKFARSIREVAAVPKDFDRDQWLLNCNNGIVDLRSGELLPHDREHLATRILPVDYHAGAKSGKWLNFLDQITGGNRKLAKFLQRAVGYSLTGDTREKCLFLIIGPGDTGKTTFIETIRAMMGDYAKTTDFETFVYGRRTNIRNDIARLEGARFVSAVEARRDDKFDMQLVKQVTGRDTFMARFLYKEFFEFSPEFKVFLAANHKPQIRGTDEAIWNRFHLIPFSVPIPKREQDKQLVNKLKDNLSGVLGWAVKGCLEWQELGGLHPPEAVRAALQRYRGENDPIYNFLTDRCYLTPDATETSLRLYREYEDWCKENDEEVDVSMKRFGMLLKERDGIEPIRTLASEEGKQARGYKGIMLKFVIREQIRERHLKSYRRVKGVYMGQVGEFLRDCYGEPIPADIGPPAEVFARYQDWCSEHGRDHAGEGMLEDLLGELVEKGKGKDIN